LKREKVLKFLNSAIGTAWIQFIMVLLVIGFANYIRIQTPIVLAHAEPLEGEVPHLNNEGAGEECPIPRIASPSGGYLRKAVLPHTQPASPMEGGEAEFYVVTGYAVGDPFTPGQVTADGRLLRPGITVACPEALPLGTALYIEGFGVRICEDRGSAIAGKTLDVAFETPEAAMMFGKQRLAVIIIK